VLTVQNATDTGPLLGVDGQPVTIELWGPGSETYVREQTNIDRSNQERMMKSIGKGAGAKVDSYVDTRAVAVKKLIACTRSISPNFPVSADALYTNVKLGYITAQASKFMEDWGNFLSVFERTSASTLGS
jgi:hypothetical protein